MLMECVSDVFGSSLKYTRELLSPDGREWALTFEASAGGVPLVGVDLVRLDEQGRVEAFEVVLRPPGAAKALLAEMSARMPAAARRRGVDPRKAMRKQAVPPLPAAAAKL